MESEDIRITLAIIALPLHKSSPEVWQGVMHSSIQEPYRRQERDTAVIIDNKREEK